MKSALEQLKARGFADFIIYDSYEHLNDQELIWLLASTVPEERTIAARMLSERMVYDSIPNLIESLQVETKLYARIAISEALTKFGLDALDDLIPLLGTIGDNQYDTIPTKPFEKTSFPLPRDIVARTIARMGKEALLHLELALLKGKREQVLEVIDAIGFIANNENDFSSFFALNHCFSRFSEDELVQWKIIRAFQTFPQAITFLNKMKSSSFSDKLKDEAKRSLLKLENKVSNSIN